MSSRPAATAPFPLVRLLLVALIAAAVNLALFGIAIASGAVLEVGGSPISPVMPPAATFGAIAVAGVITWLGGRASPPLARIAPWVGLVVALLTAASPFVVIGAPAAFWLAPMHVIAAIAWFVAVRPAGARRV